MTVLYYLTGLAFVILAYLMCPPLLRVVSAVTLLYCALGCFWKASKGKRV